MVDRSLGAELLEELCQCREAVEGWVDSEWWDCMALNRTQSVGSI